MADNEARRMQWGAPDELHWGEVVGAPAAPARDPLQAERDLLASMETAHAPVAPTSPPLRSAPSIPMHMPHSAPDGRDGFGGLDVFDAETMRTATLPPRAPIAPADLDNPAEFGRWGRADGRSPRRSAKRTLRTPGEAFGLGAFNDLWGPVRALLAEPFPRTLIIGVGVVPFVALLAGFLLQTAISGGDWAHGGLAAGVDALLLAGAVAGGLVLRYVLGRRGTAFLQLGSALLVALVIFGALGLAFSRQLHYAQAQAAERAGNFALAVAQYKLYGEAAPSAPNTARAEAAWGEQLVAAKQYANAAQHFDNALASSPKDTALGMRVDRDRYTVYSTWLTAGGDGMPYGDAATFFASFQTSSSCDATCQAAAPQFQAQALYLAGKQLASAGDYQQAAAEFDALQKQLPKSTYATQAHTDGAAAYLAWGQQLLKDPNSCKGVNSTSASLTAQYQTLLTAMQALATNYGDTAQGKQGAQMLAAPQQVTGTLSGFPTSPTPSIHLSTKVDQTHLIFSNNYNTGVDSKTGNFTFGNVNPGDYNLHTQQDVGFQVNYHIIHSSSGNLYNIHVGALCPLPLGQINY